MQPTLSNRELRRKQERQQTKQNKFILTFKKSIGMDADYAKSRLIEEGSIVSMNGENYKVFYV